MFHKSARERRSSSRRHLRRRGRSWYYRRRIPTALGALRSCGSELVVSLRTDSVRIARTRAAAVDRLVQFAFALSAATAGTQRGNGLNIHERLEELVRRWMREQLHQWEQERALGREVDEGEVEGYSVALDAFYEQLQQGVYSPSTLELARELLGRENLSLAPTEEAIFLRLLTRAWIEVVQRWNARHLGDYSADPLLSPEPRAVAGLPDPEPSGLSLGEAVDRYIGDHEGTSWSPKYAGQTRVALRYFVQQVGAGTPLRALTKCHRPVESSNPDYRNPAERVPDRGQGRAALRQAARSGRPRSRRRGRAAGTAAGSQLLGAQGEPGIYGSRRQGARPRPEQVSRSAYTPTDCGIRSLRASPRRACR